MKKNIRKALILFLLLAGSVITVYGFQRIMEASKCKGWTVVKGRIMDSYVTVIPDLPNNKTTEAYLPDIKYEYSFKGNTYFNHKIGYYGKNTLGLSDSYYAAPEEEVSEFVNNYQIDSKVDVYVNPEDPKQSILDPSLKLPVFMPFLFGILLLFAGGHIFLFGNFYISDMNKTGRLA